MPTWAAGRLLYPGVCCDCLLAAGAAGEPAFCSHRRLTCPELCWPSDQCLPAGGQQ
eukprot:bmy_19566T0